MIGRWDVLRRDGRPVTVISHTGATGMGTNWDLYNRIDDAVENLDNVFLYDVDDLEQAETRRGRGGRRVAARLRVVEARTDPRLMRAIARALTPWRSYSPMHSAT